jgi:peptidoglycan/LPS O-acetylase OafA/YrhL
MPIWLGAHYLRIPSLLKNCLDAGMVAVPFFFFLSGFVLSLAHPQGVKPGAFLLRRLARLAPLYYIALAIAIICHLRSQQGNVLAASAAHAFFLSAWIPQTQFLNFPAWSLSAEIFFYALFPALGFWMRQRSARSLLAGLGLGYAILGAGSLLLYWKISALATWPWRYPLPDPALTGFLQTHPLVHLPEFIAGMALARLYLCSPTRLANYGDLILAFGAGTTALLLQFKLPYLSLNSFFLLPCFGLILWGGVQPRGKALRWLEAKPLVLLGHASYGIYILHMPVRDLLTPWSEAISPWAFLVGFLLAFCGVSAFLYLQIEAPFRSWANAKIRR